MLSFKPPVMPDFVLFPYLTNTGFLHAFQHYQYVGVWGPVTRLIIYKHATKLKPTRALQASQRTNGKEYRRGSADSEHQELGFQLACLKLGRTCSKVPEVCALTF